MPGLRATHFKVQNFRNVDDSGWIRLDKVTALVGRNESGKTALLQALHKFNPATKLSYLAQREFPRDRFQSEYSAAKAANIPVCSVQFVIEEPLRDRIDAVTGTPGSPKTVLYTRYYDQTMRATFDPPVPAQPLDSSALTKLLDKFAATVRRIETNGPDEATETVRAQILTWTAEKRKLRPARQSQDSGRQAVISRPTN